MNANPNIDTSESADDLEHANLIFRVLKLTLEYQTLNKVLASALSELLEVSWLQLLPKAGVFVVDDTNNTLKLVVSKNLGSQINSLCDRVPFGHCLCGRAAAQGQTQHASCIDERHNVRFSEMQPHGHYNVPIKMQERLVGVLVVYLPHGHRRKEREVNFLERFANVLGLLISSKKNEQKTKIANEMLKNAQAAAFGMMDAIQRHMTVSKTSISGRITYVNDAFCLSSGYERGELIGQQHRIVNSGTHSKDFWVTYWETLTSGRSWRGEVCNKRKDGSLFWVDSVVMPMTNSDGQIEEYVAIRTDITDRKKAEEALARIGRILDESSNEIYVFEAESLKFTQLNRGARENLGYSIDDVATLSPIDILPEYSPERFLEISQPLINNASDTMSFETVFLRKDGSQYPVDVRLHYDDIEEPPVYVAIALDITERKENEAEIEKLAFYDPLTGLANRALMADRLQQAISRAKRHSSNLKLLFLDLNSFKEINDTRGHAVGDQVLIEVGRRFNEVVRQHETLARIGGDEFVIILEGIDVMKTVDVVERLSVKLAQPFMIEGKSHYVGTSIGISSYPENGATAEVLLQNADIAMYESKANGGEYRFYNQEMSKALSRSVELADRLGAALELGRLEMYYQPIVDLKTGALKSTEALLRWYEEDLGWISPGEFIPIAEERRMMNDIGDWVVERAMHDLSEWREKGANWPRRLAVNVAAQQLESGLLLEKIVKSADKFDIPLEILEVEITETSMMKDPERVNTVLQQLGKIGINIAIDDFGTGYSSLAYLRNFRADKLKIDMSFIRDLVVDSNCQAIVSSTIAMAKGMDITVLAEGVETEEQAQYLLDLECDEAQGYLFGKPMPASEFADTWLTNDYKITSWRDLPPEIKQGQGMRRVCPKHLIN